VGGHNGVNDNRKKKKNAVARAGGLGEKRETGKNDWGGQG